MATIATSNSSNNYKVSSAEIFESIGDGISGVLEGTMVTQGTLTITPDDGYVVSASNFSITGDLPSEVSSVTFTDTTTAGQVGNLITVTAIFASNFEISQAYQIIYLDIDGSTEEYSPDIIDYIFDFTVSVPDFSNIVLTPVSGVTIDSLTEAIEIDEDKAIPISGQANVNENTNIATLTVNAEAGYQIDNQPYLSYNNMVSDMVSLDFVSMQANSPATSYVFNVMFKSSVTVKENKSSYASLNYTISQVPDVKKEIVDVARGETNISILGETRPITIFGDSEADFDITITQVSTGDSILNETISNSTILSPDRGSINSINKKLESGSGIKSFKFDQIFPANPDVLSTTIKTTQTSTTMALNGTNPTNSLKVGDILVYDDITDQDNLTGAGQISPVTIASITDADEIVLSGTLIQASGDSVSFRRDEKYDINIYPKDDSKLGPNISALKPHFRLTQRPKPVLTIAGIVASNYAWTTYSKVVYEASLGAKKNKLRDGKGAVGATATTNLNNELFTVTWVATASGGYTFTTADNPVWSSKTRYNSDSTNDFAFKSRSLDGTDTYGQQLVKDTGYDIEIFNAKTTLSSGNTVATITFDVLVKKFGDQDASILLITSNHLTPTN